MSGGADARGPSGGERAGPDPRDEPAVHEPGPDGSPGPPTGTPDTAGTAGRRPSRRLGALLLGLVLAAALAFFLFVILGTPARNGTEGPLVAVGTAAPDFTLPSLTGGPPVSLDALGRNHHRPVVLNFFASWCVPCQKETPLLASTARAEAAKGSPVQFVGVDVNDPKADALAFVRQAGIVYPVGTDTNLQVTTVLYGLNAQPNTFFISASGVVIGHVLGAVDQATLDAYLHRLAGAAG